MLFFCCFILFLRLGRSSTECDCDPTHENMLSDYYWREYLGVIPNDALPGGLDKSGARTYIGQVIAKDSLLPATIQNGSQIAIASIQGVSISKVEFVKILCTRNPSRYQWVLTDNSKTHLFVKVHLVIGGTESGYVLNIGRVNHEMQVLIGKILAHHTPNKGLSIPYRNKEVIYQTFEILTYQYPECSKDCTNVSVY